MQSFQNMIQWSSQIVANPLVEAAETDFCLFPVIESLSFILYFILQGVCMREAMLGSISVMHVFLWIRSCKSKRQ